MNSWRETYFIYINENSIKKEMNIKKKGLRKGK